MLLPAIVFFLIIAGLVQAQSNLTVSKSCASNSTSSQAINYTVSKNQTTLLVPVPGLENNISIGLTNEILGGTFNTLSSLIIYHKYEALFVLLTLDHASIPVPTEIVNTIAGYLSYICFLDPATAWLAIAIGSLFGMAIDYSIGYYLGREFFYRHISVLHIKKERLESFDSWFNENGDFAVFVTRLLPVVHSVMSFPAGFAKMPKAKFFAYSLAGVSVWNTTFLLYGYFLIGTGSVTTIFLTFSVLLIALYLAYKKIMKSKGKR